MRTNEKGIELLKHFETLELEAYVCPAGVVTIGYGHTRTAKMGMTITGERAEELLALDLAEYEKAVSQYAKVGLSSNEFSALVLFSFNVGISAFKNSTLLRKLNAGDKEGASREFGRWNKSKGKVLRGLTRRREAERVLFLTP